MEPEEVARLVREQLGIDAEVIEDPGTVDEAAAIEVTFPADAEEPFTTRWRQRFRALTPGRIYFELAVFESWLNHKIGMK